MKLSDIPELQYLTDLENVRSILGRGILSHSLANTVPHKKIDMVEVQEKREAKSVPGGRPLHEYANLYFTARNPMLFKRKDVHKEICVLRIKMEVLYLPGVVVTTGNAASNYVAFHPPRTGIEKLDANLVFAKYWTDEDKIKADRKRVAKCAEVLVPDYVSPRLILGVHVSCNESKEKLKSVAPDLPINVNPELFFQK